MRGKKRRRLDKSSAFSYACSLLSHRDRSEGEMRQRLGRRGYPGEVIDFVVAELREIDYLDDEKFCRSWLRWRQEERPRSRGMIRWELLAKGVEEGVISEALEELYPPEKEIDVARRLAEKRAALAGSNRKRVYDYLRRKGFSYDVISKALDHIERS